MQSFGVIILLYFNPATQRSRNKEAKPLPFIHGCFFILFLVIEIAPSPANISASHSEARVQVKVLDIDNY